MTVVLAPLELIRLVGHNQDGPLVMIQPSLHLAVMLSWFMTDIHDQHDTLKSGALPKIGFNRFLPATTNCFRHLRVAITRQIDQMKQVINTEKIDQLGLTWRGASLDPVSYTHLPLPPTPYV